MSIDINRDDFAAAVAEYALTSLHLYGLAADLSTAAASIVAGWRGEGADEFSELVNRSIVPMIQGLQIKIGEFVGKLGSEPENGVDSLNRFKTSILELTEALSGDDAVSERSRLDASLERVYMWDNVQVPVMSAITNGQYYLETVSRAFVDAEVSLARTIPALPALNVLRFSSLVARGNHAFDYTREKYRQCEIEQATFAETIAVAGNQVATLGVTSFERLFDDVHGKCLDLPAQGYLLGCPKELLTYEELTFVALFTSRGMGCPDLNERSLQNGSIVIAGLAGAVGVTDEVMEKLRRLLSDDPEFWSSFMRYGAKAEKELVDFVEKTTFWSALFEFGAKTIAALFAISSGFSAQSDYLKEHPELPNKWRENNASCSAGVTMITAPFLLALAFENQINEMLYENEYDEELGMTGFEEICAVRYSLFGKWGF